MNRSAKLRTVYQVTWLITFVVGCSVLSKSQPQPNMLPGLPIFVNLATIFLTLGLIVHFLIVHYLIFVGQADKNDTAYLSPIFLGYSFCVVFSGNVVNLSGYMLFAVIYLLFVSMEHIVLDWPKQLTTIFKKWLRTKQKKA